MERRVMRGRCFVEAVERYLGCAADSRRGNDAVLCLRWQFADNCICQSSCIGQGCRTVPTALVKAQQQLIAGKGAQLPARTSYPPGSSVLSGLLGSNEGMALRAGTSPPHLIAAFLRPRVHDLGSRTAIYTNHVYILSYRY